MMKKIILGLIVIAALAGGFGYYKHNKNEEEAQAKVKKAGPVEVSVMTIEQKPVPLYKELPGRVNAFKISEIRPQVSGIIIKRLFEEGSDVKEGDQLYQIDPAPYAATYNSTKADLQKAEANKKSVSAKAARYAKLVKIGGVSKQELDDINGSLDQAKADIAIAQAAMDTAKINVEYTKVYAPISGRVGKSNITEGALVTASQSQPLATVTQLDPVYVDLTQSSKDMMEMRHQLINKEKANVSLFTEDSADAYAQPGVIQFSEVTVDPTTGSVQMRALFPNPDHLLLPGLFVRARIELSSNDGILIPQASAVRNPDGSLSAWILGKDNKAEKHPIIVSEAVGNQWLVKDGVKAGDVLITQGFQKIGPDGMVKPVDTNAQPQAAAPAAATVPSAAPQVTTPTQDDKNKAAAPKAAQ